MKCKTSPTFVPAAFLAAFLAASATADRGAAQQFPGIATELPPGFTTLPFDAGAPLAVPPQAATSVQLPTFNFFTISTSVLVPDRGGALLGGVGGGTQTGRTGGAPGLPANRAVGAGIGAGGTSVTTQVHDLRAMDRALRDGDSQSAEALRLSQWHDRLARAKRSTAGRPTVSVAEARAKVGR